VLVASHAQNLDDRQEAGLLTARLEDLAGLGSNWDHGEYERWGMRLRAVGCWLWWRASSVFPQGLKAGRDGVRQGMPLPEWYEVSSHKHGRQLDTSLSPKTLRRSWGQAGIRPENSDGRVTEAKADATNNKQAKGGR
jgi:hypothetical protein